MECLDVVSYLGARIIYRMMPFVENLERYSRILLILTTVLLAMMFSNVLEVKIFHYRDNLEQLKILSHTTCQPY